MNKEIVKKILCFRDDRDWKKFHTGENLAKSLIIESAELLEHFQWTPTETSIEGIKEELADVFIYAILIAEAYDLDINQIISEKIEKNNEKYPIEKSKGRSDKYNKL